MPKRLYHCSRFHTSIAVQYHNIALLRNLSNETNVEGVNFLETVAKSFICNHGLRFFQNIY